MGATEEEAQRAQADLRDELTLRLSAPEPMQADSTTVADYAERWVEAKARRVRPSVADRYSRDLAVWVLPRLGHIRLVGLTRAEVEEWVAWVETVRKPPPEEGEEGDRYARETVQGWWRILRSLICDAVAEYGLPADPTSRVRAPSPRLPRRRETRTLTAGEVGVLLEAIRTYAPSRYAETFVLAYTGMRVGEAFALRWKDVQDSRDRILIRRTVWRGHVEEQPKTGEPREVPLTPQLSRVLRAHRAELVAAQEIDRLKTGLVFPSETGTMRTAASLHKPLALAAGAAKLPARVTPQVLRRTFNTLLLHAGVDRVVLRSQMGHSSEEMTERYAGIAIEAKRAAVEQLARMVESESGL